MRIWSGPNFLHIERVLSAPQIDLSACPDKKMVILYVYLHICTKKTQFYRTDTQKKNEMVCEGKTFTHRPMRICLSVYSLKKSQPKSIGYVSNIGCSSQSHQTHCCTKLLGGYRLFILAGNPPLRNVHLGPYLVKSLQHDKVLQ
jgi:hypothetical protein